MKKYKKALFWEELKGFQVRCKLCPHNCIIDKDKTGICGVRKNISGELYATTYGLVSAVAIDPMEKKPLYHFYPGKDVLSFGTIGCNFKCPYCQNWHISQNTSYPVEFISPEEAVEIAIRRKVNLIAYTYSEPLIWYEFVLDTAKLAHEKGIKNVLVTNGYINSEPLKELVKYIDAANIDVKAFNQNFYSKLCKGKLEPVLKNVEYLYDKIHIELTMLLIPGWNDDEEEIKEFVDWVSSLSKDIPVHFSRYFPQYKFDVPATPPETIKMAYDIAKEKLNYVYVGNIHIPGASDTYCPECGHLLIRRTGYFIEITGIKEGKCTNCGTKIAIVME